MKRIYTQVLFHKFEIILLLLFVILSAMLRFAPLLKGETPFLFDHGRDMLAVKQIVVDHKPTLIGPFTGLQGVFQSPLHFYLLAIPFLITGGNPVAGTGMMVLLALVGIVLCFFLGKKMIAGWFGILLALFFSFSPTSLAFSAHFWNPHWIPFCMILFYYFLYKSIFVSNKFWPWVGLITGLIAQFEVAFGLPLFISLFVVGVLFKIKSLKNKYFWSIIPAFLFTFFPQMLFDIRHQFLMTKTIVSFLHGANGGTGATIPFFTRLLYRVNEIQLATIFTVSDNRVIGYLLTIPSIVFLFIAIYLKMKKELKTFFLFFIIPLFFFISFLFYSHQAWSWYWIGLQISYYCLLAFVFSTLIKLSRVGIIFSLFFIGIWIFGTIVPEISRLPMVEIGDTGTIKNELRVIDFMYRDAHGRPFGEFVYTPPVYDYAYQYLFWWKSNQYHYAPTNDKRGIFYVIVEPDKERPYAAKGWKETVIKTGTILWDKTFQGDISVQKRDGNR